MALDCPLTALCEVCSGFNLKKDDFFGTFTNDGRSVTREDAYVPGHLIDVRKRAENCPLCWLIVRAVDDCSTTPIPLKHEGFYEVRLKWPFVPLSRRGEASPWARPLTVSCMIWNIPPGESVPSREREVRFNKIAILHEDVSVLNILDTGRLIPSEHIDVKLIEAWLKLCQDFHGASCKTMKGLQISPHKRQTDWFWLIDVKDLCVVKGDADSEWIALSYNWGKPPEIETTRGKFKDLQTPGALNNDDQSLATTIADAILLTQQLSVKYLWIDRFCIDQDDTQMIEAAMLNMDMVYANAVLTIVAASGTDAAAGLPGVVEGCRGWKQPVATIEPGFRLMTGRVPIHSFPATRYNSRAWTYQEYILSNRRLIFLEGTVLFECRTSTWHEDTMCEDLFKVSLPGRNDLFSIIQSNLVESDVDSPIPMRNYPGLDNIFGAYNDVVYAYTSRHLSFQSDVIRACYSILSMVCAQMNSDIFFGLPVLVFDWSMLFRNQEPEGLQRRRPFPSWSWTGWVGKISISNTLPHTVDYVADFMLKRKFLHWNFIDPWTEQELPLPDRQALPPASDLPYSEDTRNSIPSAMFYQHKHPLSKPSPYRPCNINFTNKPLPSDQRPDGTFEPSIFDRCPIQTCGVVAHFKLTAASRKYQPVDIDNLILGPSRKQWALFDRNNVWSGFFYPHPNTESIRGKVLNLSVLLHSASILCNEEDVRDRFQKYQNMTARLGTEKFNTYTRNADNLLCHLANAAERVRALRIHDPEEAKYVKQFQATALSHDYDFVNVLGLTPYEDSIAFESCGVGWIFKSALVHAVDPAPSWRRIILV